MRYPGCNKLDDEEGNTEQGLHMDDAALFLFIKFRV
jgi:hypothetical protein